MSKNEERTKFLLQMHSLYWNNISRAEEASWKMMAAYTALIAGLSVAVPTIGYIGFLAVFIPFSFMSISISLNANLWFLRNIGLISNLEKEFLKDEDYDYLIPKRWREKLPFVNSEPWWIFIIVYFSVCLVVTLLMLSKINYMEQVITISLFIICFILTLLYGVKMRNRYEKFKKDAPGK
jgi:hypothetical protein